MEMAQFPRDQTSDLQLLVDSAPSLIHTGRPNGYLDFFNQTWLRYIGRSLEDLQGRKWTAFIHPEDVEGIELVPAEQRKTTRLVGRSSEMSKIPHLVNLGHCC